MSVIVIEFTTLDGVVSDPDGSAGSPGGGWAFRYGPEAVAGDKFRLGEVLDHGALLLGRRTWELFAGLWPTRDDPFSRRMNAAPKLVVTSSPVDPSAWSGSRPVADPVEAVRRSDQDVIITGSLGVVRPLLTAGLVDEVRLLTFPLVLGDGERLFTPGTRLDLTLAWAEVVGPAILSCHRRAAADEAS